MITYNCDVCGKEIESNEAHRRPIFRLAKVQVEAIRAVDGVWNDGEICLECIQKCVAEGTTQFCIAGTVPTSI